MVKSIENIKASNLCLLTNIEGFLLLDMGSHDIDYDAKQRFRRQLHYAIFILDQQTEDGDENNQQHLWDRGRELIDSENTMETMRNSFNRHWVMYARLLYSFYQGNQGGISHIDRFLNSYRRSLSSDISSSDSSSSNGADL